MFIKKEILSACKVKLYFTVNKAEVSCALDKSFNKNVKEKELIGFRKGHIPRSIYEKYFGIESLYTDAINFAVNDEIEKYFKENFLNYVHLTIDNIDYQSFNEQKELKFSILCELYPTVKLGQYKGIEITKQEVTVSNEEFTAYLNSLLKNYQTIKNVEGVSLKEGNIAIFDFEGSINGIPFTGGKAENYSLEIGSGNFIPGFEEQMIDMAIGEEKIIQVKFPEDYIEKSLAGQYADFKINLHQIQVTELPVLNDDLVKNTLKIENVNTVNELYDYIFTVIYQDNARKIEDKFLYDLSNIVLNNSEIIMPDFLIDSEINSQINKLQKTADQAGIDIITLLKLSGIKSLDSYKEQLKPVCERNLKYQFVYTEIANVENIQITDKDYTEEYTTIMNEYNCTLEDAQNKYSKIQLSNYLKVKKAEQLVISSTLIKSIK